MSTGIVIAIGSIYIKGFNIHAMIILHILYKKYQHYFFPDCVLLSFHCSYCFKVENMQIMLELDMLENLPLVIISLTREIIMVIINTLTR